MIKVDNDSLIFRMIENGSTIADRKDAVNKLLWTIDTVHYAMPYGYTALNW